MAAPISDEPTKEDILEAINVLKRAGLNISVSPALKIDNNLKSVSDEDLSKKKYTSVNPAEYINSDYETMRMMLGNGNNNNNDPMMNMLPYMLNANNDGKNIDPQVMQTLMMNSMMSGISGLNSTDNK